MFSKGKKVIAMCNEKMNDYLGKPSLPSAKRKDLYESQISGPSQWSNTINTYNVPVTLCAPGNDGITPCSNASLHGNVQSNVHSNSFVTGNHDVEEILCEADFSELALEFCAAPERVHNKDPITGHDTKHLDTKDGLDVNLNYNIENENRNPENNVMSPANSVQPVQAEPQPCPAPKRKRSATANPATWKCNIVKQQRAQGLPYYTKKGLKPGKVPKPVDCKNCRFKCNEHFTEEERKEICQTFWGLRDFNRQKDFIIQCVKVGLPKRRKKNADRHRLESRQYFLKYKRREFRVCNTFFQKTLSISNGPINYAVTSTSATGMFSGFDKRGRKAPGNKTSETVVKGIKEHIESFPVMGRKSSSKKYLDSKLSIVKMHKLYEEFCREHNTIPANIHIYRKVFCTHYNYSFLSPKKNAPNGNNSTHINTTHINSQHHLTGN